MTQTVHCEPGGRSSGRSSALKVAVVLPAYEAEATIAGVLGSLPRRYFQHVIVVDDHSKDRTFEIACADKSVLVYRNTKNLGYGGNLKRCFRLALDLDADILVEYHPDGEYGLESVGPAIEKISAGAGIVLGNRFAAGGDPLKNGMYLWKYPFIKILNRICNCVLGTNLGDLHQGFRVYSAAFLKDIDFDNNSDKYIFSFQIIAQAVHRRFSIQEVPQSCHYQGKKRGARLKPVIVYTLAVFWVLIQFIIAKLGVAVRLFRKPASGGGQVKNGI